MRIGTPEDEPAATLPRPRYRDIESLATSTFAETHGGLGNVGRVIRGASTQSLKRFIAVLAIGVGLAIPAQATAGGPDFPTSSETTFIKAVFTTQIRAALAKEGAKFIADTMRCQYRGRQRFTCFATYWVELHGKYAEAAARTHYWKVVGRSWIKDWSSSSPPDPYDVDQCLQGSAHQANLGSPAIAEGPGAQVEVLFVDRLNRYVRYCTFKGDTLSVATGEPLSDVPVPHDPNGIAYQDRTCVQYGRHVSSDTFGRVGNNVIGATFKFAHGKAIRSGVLRGFYEAAWSSGASPDSVTLTTRSGSTVDVQLPQPPATDKCLNFTGL